MDKSKSTVTVRRDVLQSWLNVSGCNQTRLADQLHVSKGRISQLLHSDQEPSARLIAGLLHLTNLPFERLFTIMERRTMRRAQQVSKETAARPAASQRRVRLMR